MAYSNRYGKPNMTNLPPELGRGIFRQIMNTPRPDFDRIHQEAQKVERAIVNVRRNEDAQAFKTLVEVPDVVSCRRCESVIPNPEQYAIVGYEAREVSSYMECPDSVTIASYIENFKFDSAKRDEILRRLR